MNNPFEVADVILKGLDVQDLPEDPLMDIMEGRKKERKQRDWQLSKCVHCGEVIHVIDDYFPYFCPKCGERR